MTLDECAEKARRCGHFAVNEFSEDKVNQLVEMLTKLENLDDVRSLTEILHYHTLYETQKGGTKCK